MNIKITLKLVLLTLLPLFINSAYAQNNTGTIKGTVKNRLTDKTISGVEIKLFNKNVENFDFASAEATTDAQGSFTFDNIDPGSYIIISSKKEFENDTQNNISISSDQLEPIEIFLKSNNLGLEEKAIIVNKNNGLKDKLVDNSTTTKYTGEQLVKSGFRNTNDLVQFTAGVTRTSAGLSGRGSRVDGTVYFLDGVRVINSSISQGMSGQVDILQAGIPAQYGDFTGLGVAITTKGGVSTNKITSFEVQSSSLFNPYHNNLFEFFTARPVLFKDNPAYATGKSKLKRIPIAAVNLAANFTYRADNPSFVPYTQIKDEKLAELEREPLAINKDGGFVHASNFLTENDYDRVKVKKNARQYSANAQAKFDLRLTDLATLSFFGNFVHSNSLNPASSNNGNNNILNYKNNPLVTRTDVLGYIKYLQKFKDPDSTKRANGSTLNNTSIFVRLDYQSTWTKTQDANFRDNIFNYGYVGTFKHYPTAFYSPVQISETSPARKFVDQNGDTVYLKNFLEQTGFRDTALRFTKADINQTRGNYTQSIFDNAREIGSPIFNDQQILEQQGLLNGYNPNNIYSLFNTPGTQLAGYSKGQAERYTLYALGETTLKGRVLENKQKGGDHIFQFGITYEQTVNRSYGLNANNLWRIMNQLANSHIAELDKTNPILSYDANGVFRDTVKYNRLVNSESQTTFDKEFRNKLINQGATDIYGKKIDSRTFLDINAFGPDDFNLNMFSADELLNNGSAIVAYNGYDYLGNKVRGRPSVSDFMQNKSKRSIGAFMPIYTAAWFQDKFSFNNLEFRLGLRLERYDANQLVLKDPYSLYPIKTVGEVSSLGGNPVSHPSNIGSDYAVYVDDNTSANPKILGYRKDNQWYNENGILTTGDFIAGKSNGGSVKPLLVNASKPEITENSFKDFQPKINILPRIFFKFPLNKSSLFFASYDILAQRPGADVSFATIDDYFFLPQKASGTIANPALSTRLTTDYQIGFKQQVNKSILISFMTYYRETKNDVSAFQFNNAYPITYISYNNIDFSTVKGFVMEFDYRAKNNISFNGNYTLQFADGTGSNIDAQRALIASNQPNLRSLFPLGDLDIRHQIKGGLNWEFFDGKGVGKLKSERRYRGPVIGKTKLLSNTNFNISYSATSGAPYTATSQPVQLGSADRASIKGSPLGSRLPWQFTTNLNITKDIVFKRISNKTGKERQYNVQVYYFVTNLFNTQNVNRVWSYTGSVKDDGFLNSPKGQQALQSQLSAEAYNFYYRTAVNDPGRYQAPRFMRLGAKFFFN